MCTGLEAQLPAVEVHAGQLAVVGLGDVNVERLTLVDEGTAIGRHLQDDLLRNLPNGLVEGLEIGRKVQALDGPVGGDQLVLHLVVPQVTLGQVSKEMVVDDLQKDSSLALNEICIWLSETCN